VHYLLSFVLYRNCDNCCRNRERNKYSVCHLKHNPTTITYYGTKMKSEAGPPPRNRLSQLPPMTLDSRSPLLLGRCSSQLLRSCAGANIVYSRTERVFILEHYFAFISLAAVREAFSSAYPDKEVPNKTKVHRLIKFRVDACLLEVSGHFQHLL
jgi:hypothetical protein